RFGHGRNVDGRRRIDADLLAGRVLSRRHGRDAQGDLAGHAAGSLGDDLDHHLRALARTPDHDSRFRAPGYSDQADSVALRGALSTMAEHRWYAIQTTAGHENKVRSLILRKIDADARTPEERSIRQALVPTQEVVEIKNGKKVTVERKLYPGYVLVEMDMNQET